MTLSVSLGSKSESGASLVAQLVQDGVASQLFSGDPTLWGAEAETEARDRLGWIEFSQRAEKLIPRIEALREELTSAGIDRIVLCGMGGSSLAPKIIAKWAGVSLTVLDSTHPGRVSRVVRQELRRTAVVVSSKSGSTVETLSHKAAFEQAFAEAGLDAAQHMIVVTDPGSQLGDDAARAGWRVFHADPSVGGRYSALTAFGLVPAGLAGADIRGLVMDALEARAVLAADSPTNPAILLSAGLADGLPERYVIGVYSAPDADWGLGAWVEQLIAESTGKNGRGILPIDLARHAPEIEAPPTNMLTVSIGERADTEIAHRQLQVTGPLGAQLLLWEAATAIVGRIIGVNPFDQPDVESAKVAAREILDSSTPTTRAGRPLGDHPGGELLTGNPEISTTADIISWLRRAVTADGYISVQAYLDEKPDLADSLDVLRSRLTTALQVPVSLDWGPRFLHSTGQFHKGGPSTGVFIQLLDSAGPDFPIPDSENGFGSLMTAQAQGDLSVLTSRGLPVVTLRSAAPHELVEALLAALG